MERSKEIRAVEAHLERFGVAGKAFLAPGRVNLIGEHTDYTGGFVMPAAIDFGTVAVVSGRADGKAVFVSVNFESTAEYDLESLKQGTTPAPRGDWSDYCAGAAWALAQEGIALPGFSMTVLGDVPWGAGLSSSASVEVVTALGLLSHAGVAMRPEKMAVVCRRAENEYVGAKSGIMDQFVVSCGAAGKALMLDCRSLEYDLLPMPEDVCMVICNSMVKHAVAGGEYGNRSDEVEAGQAALRKFKPGIELLRDATLADLEACESSMSRESFLRCRHIITENARVMEARAALLSGDMTGFGELMRQAHLSFRDDFAASCPEVDLLVEIVGELPGCIGARITGGGFGGCTVNLVKAAQAEAFGQSLKVAYLAKTGISAEVYLCKASDGAHPLG
ncbi:MAG: galactokinase [Acidobacteriaceae bacterium]